MEGESACGDTLRSRDRVRARRGKLVTEELRAVDPAEETLSFRSENGLAVDGLLEV